MSKLTVKQTGLLRGIFCAAPDNAVSNLEQALSVEADKGGAMADVHGLIVGESAVRRVRRAVFGPLCAVCRPSKYAGLRFPSRIISSLWEIVREAHPNEAFYAEGACLNDSEGGAAFFDELCGYIAEGLRNEAEAYAPAIAILDAAGPAMRAEFVRYLDLAPLSRQAITRLPEWVGRLTEEGSAAARLAYKDASELADDAGPRFFEILFANLAEPWLILRLISVVMDRPTDRYLASSELARFGDYLMDDIDRRLESFGKFDPAAGRAAGIAAGEEIRIAAQEIAEFEGALELNRDGLWGKRLAKQRQTLAGLAESRYGQIEKALDQVLPLQMVRFGKGLRGRPKLVLDPDSRLLLRAEGLMGFFEHSRGYASTSGFGAARAKMSEKIEARLDQYIEDLLEMLRAEDIENLDRIRAYIEVSAEFVEVVRGEKAAQIVRRRAAA